MISLQSVSSAAQQLPLSDKLSLLTDLVDWIRREFPMFSNSKTAEYPTQVQNDFYKSYTVEELMVQQGITGPQTIRPLDSFEDDVDELVATIRQWRDEDVESENL